MKLLMCAAVACMAVAAQSPPQLLLLDRNHLEDVSRTDVARNVGRNVGRNFSSAKSALIEEATKALAMKPVSVMDKTVTPPSGDKHDYMSQAPYFWPDPAKTDGKPYIRRDGERNPEINRISDHENLGRVMSAVSTLGLAFYFSEAEAELKFGPTKRNEYAAHAARLVRAWFIDAPTRMNPHLNFGQGIPGITDGRGIGIIETRGLPDLLDGVLLISVSKAWTPADESALQAWMRSYLTWLIDSPHGKAESKNGNNHETYYDVQVASLALYTHQPELARATLLRSRERIARQIEPDGGQPRELERTRSWDYSIMNLTGWMALATLGDRVGVDLWNYRAPDGRGIRQALDFLVPYAAGERPWTRAQITPFRASALHTALRRAAVAWKEPKYAALAEKVGGGSWKTELTIPRY